jgi:Ca2+-binding EF-hand superfamily protein
VSSCRSGGLTWNFVFSGCGCVSGEIDIHEIEKGIRRLGLGLTPAQLEWLLQTMDADQNGGIDRAEFISRLPCR